MSTIVSDLLQYGVVVYPIPADILASFDVQTFLSEQKEYCTIDDTTEFIISNFGAFGNPSSQHHPLIRNLRLSLFHLLCTMLSQHETFQSSYLQCLPDRFSQRRKNPPKEAWHKDVSIDYSCFPGSIILGGWVNLDDSNQYFSCIPGSHQETASGEGFATLTKDEKKKYNAQRARIIIPPGHAISFVETITHEIADVPITGISRKLYMKYHISQSDTSAFPVESIQRAINQQGVFAMNQWTSFPMYEKNHVVFWGDKIEEFSRNIQPMFLAHPNKKGKVYVQRYMCSLAEAGVELFPSYSEEEITILFPMRILS